MPLVRCRFLLGCCFKSSRQLSTTCKNTAWDTAWSCDSITSNSLASRSWLITLQKKKRISRSRLVVQDYSHFDKWIGYFDIFRYMFTTTLYRKDVQVVEHKKKNALQQQYNVNVHLSLALFLLFFRNRFLLYLAKDSYNCSYLLSSPRILRYKNLNCRAARIQ